MIAAASRLALPVADTWFVTTTVDDWVSVICEPHVDPLLRANIWHVRGRNRDLVVDTGLGVSPLRPAVPQLFEHDPLLVVTHAHLDHMGSAWEFEDCAAHPLEPIGTPMPGTLHTRRLMTSFGMIVNPDHPPGPELMITALPWATYDPDDYVLRPAQVTRSLRDGDTIDLGDRQLTVLHLAGHSPGSVALYDEEHATLYSGDVIYDDELLDDVDGSDIPAYLTTMARLRALPVDVVHPGHGASFSGERMRAIIDGYVESRTITTP